MRTRYRQRGVSFIGWLIILALVGFFASVVLKLAPVYLEHFGVTGSLRSLEADAGITGSDRASLRNTLIRRLDMNDVKRVKSEDIAIERDGAYHVVTIDYEVRVPLIGNIDLVVHFEDVAEVSAR